LVCARQLDVQGFDVETRRAILAEVRIMFDEVRDRAVA
jgi:hypothetical protein